MNAVNFQEFFQWVSSSLGSVASSRPGEGIQLAPVNAWATVSA
jgi:uncharacterized protein YegL